MPPPADDARLIGRAGIIWKLHIAGASETTIGQRLPDFGYPALSQQRVSDIVREIKASLPAPDKADILRREIELLETLRVDVLKLWDSDPAPAYSAGRPVLDDNGKTVADHSGRLAALNALINLHTKLDNLLGLAAPKRQEVAITGAEDATTAVAAEAAAYLNDEPESTP